MEYNLEELDKVANYLIGANEQHKIWCFYGEMGVGKTTLIKSLLKQLGVIDLVSSPSFSIVNEYQTSTGQSIYHFDFYRIKSISEVYDLGFEAYFDSGSLCLIEWPENIEEILKVERHLKIHISLIGERRKLVLE
jgi:tRNA threonylcarbamoyladenosine biosynthesis protein TsaE